MVWCYCTLK